MAVRKPGYRWHLRRLMAEKDLYAATQLRPLLAERGVELSREQVWRLITGVPERLSLATLAALCDILHCGPGDLIEPVAGGRRAAGPAVDAVAPGGQALRQLADALAADPGVLTAGAPPVAGRLAAELIARGSAALAIPACTVCGRTGKPLFRGDGGGVCQRCRAWQVARPCATCGKVKPVAGFDEHGRAVCEVCRRRDNPRRHRECAACGKTAPVAVRGRDGRAGICTSCYQLPEATCSKCQQRRPCTYAATSQPVCPSCSPRATAVCARCGHDRPPQARWPEGPVCDPCYRAALHHRGPCARCGQQRRLVAPPGPGADTCADCAGIPVFSACTDCGTEDKLYEKGRCARCSLHRRARELLADPAGTVPPALASVVEAITATRQPRVALNWLRQGAAAALLADIAARRLALTHEALDACPRRKAADYLRHVLTASGALPPRDEHLARTERWLQELLTGIEPPEDRRLVQAYATWQMMRRLRASAKQNRAHPHRERPQQHPGRRQPAAWLRSRHTTLSDCRQGDVDQWLRTRPSASLARDFLTWASSRGHAQRLDIPAPARATGAAISQDQRWTHAARLLHDDALDPTDRVAGCLLLLYGQPLSRIATMTASQVTRRDGETFIRLGRHDVPVPSPLAGTLRQLISGGRSHQGVGSPPATTWLFPGHLPGRPITPATLGERLRALGIYAQTGRRAALLDLAAQLPAAVLADLLGLHQTTAAKWMHQAGGDWSRYAAELVRSHPHQT